MADDIKETETIDTKCREGVKIISKKIDELDDKLNHFNVCLNTKQDAHPLNELAAALAKAQGEMEMAPKDSSAFGNRKYADLATCIRTASKPLSKNGLSVVQRVIRSGNERLLSTMLLHSSGQYIESLIDIEEESGGQTKNNLQSLGSSISYLRRYMYCAIIGLAQEDNDAEDIPAKQNAFVKPVSYANK